MKIATFNVNGVNGRLPRLLEWLDETAPDVACLQEIKTGDATFPARAIEAAGYGAVWHGQRAHHGVAVLGKGEAPHEIQRGLPGDADDRESRYLEASTHGLVVASSTSPTEIRSPGRGSSTSSHGLRALPRTRRRCSPPASKWCSLATSTSCRPTPTSTTRGYGGRTR
jgi:exodeoxyribonuclease-3